MNTKSSISLVNASADNPLVLVSVIVPVFNGEATLPTLLESLAAQDYPQDLIQVLIADDASTDNTLALLEKHQGSLEIVRQLENRGSYAARNAALAKANGDIIVFTDDDCQPDADWLSCGVRAVQTQGGGLVAGSVAIEPVDSGSAIQRYDQAFGIPQESLALCLRIGATANLFVHRSVLEKVPRFDARMRSGGDYAFCKACTAADVPFSYEPKSRVQHSPRTSLRELVVKRVRIARGHLFMFKRRMPFYKIVRLSQLSPVFFDYSAFSRESNAWFRWRFRAVYYYMALVYIATCASSQLGLLPEERVR